MATPWFFEHLGIEATTDSRSIRRAYAIALKKLDQETQAQEFERLRQAYERALAWQERFAIEEDEEEQEDAAKEPHRDEEYRDPPQAQEVAFHHAPQPSLAGQAIEVEYSDARQHEARPPHNPASHSPAPHAHAQAPHSQATPIAVNHSQASARAENATPEQTQSQPQAPSEYSTQEFIAQEFNAQEFSEQEFSDQSKFSTQSSSQAAHQAEHQAHLDSATGFKLFIALVEASPAKASELLQSKLNDDEALISLEARLQFEYQLIAWLQQHSYPQHVLLSAAIQAFRWQEQLPPLTDRSLHSWLQRIVEQWSQWQQETPAFKNRVIKGANKNKWLISLNENQTLQQSCLRYPLWMLFVLSPEQVDKFTALAKQSAKLTAFQQKPAFKLLWALLIVLFVLSGALRLFGGLLDDEKRAPKKKVKPVPAFVMTPELCEMRATLVGRWGDIRGNYKIYSSFKAELGQCIVKDWWPESKVSSKEYSRLLDRAHRITGDPGDVSLVGLERKIIHHSLTPPKNVVMVCNQESQASPMNDPVAAGCVSLAITYQFPQYHSTNISQEFCAKRSKLTRWHFDPGVEWQNYLAFKQEVLDCLENDWWVGDASDYLSRLKQAWKAAPKEASAVPKVKTIEGSRVVISPGSQLKVGPGGKMTISADGVKVEGNVTVNGQPISNQSIKQLYSKEDNAKP